MGMKVVSKYKKQALLLLFLLGLCLPVYAGTTGSITIPGSIQVGDTVTLSINGYIEKMYYGPYSTVDSIAAGLAAKLSSDCNGPANARSAPGGIVNVKMRQSGVVSQLSISVATKIPTTSTATISSTVIPNGGSTTISGQVDCGTACSGVPVDFQIDGAEWTTAALNASGQFTISTPTNWAPGLHNVVANFQGNDTYLASTSNAVSFTISTSSNPSLPSTTIYGYSILQPDGVTSGYAPNGNVLAYVDSVNGQWSNIVYDGLNRLTAANYSQPSGTTEYMCWGYDSFGNRTYQKELPTPCSSSPPPPLQYDAGNHAAGISYDASGNVTNDGTNKYLYDAEGRVCAMQSLLGGAQVGYIYDAEGRRVAKGTITTLSCDMTSNGFTETAGYVLGSNGEQMTEMDGSGNWVHTNVFAAGQLIATYENDGQGVHFHLSDWLGTRHVSTDYAGNLQSTYQNLPFGELIPPNQSLGVTEHFFTGKERDTESGLDYFGARYYASSMGRWMSPDWSAKAEPVPYSKLGNPQTLNLYAYVGNNPVSMSDSDGHTGDTAIQCGDNGGTCTKPVLVGQPKQPMAQQHLGNAVRDLKAAVSETTAKVTIGLGVGAKTSLGPLKLRGEVAEKDNLMFSNGKIAISNTMEAGVSGGTSKQIGLGGSINRVVGSYDMNSGSFGGAESPETEWVVGGRNGGTSAEASRGSLSVGGEEGEGVLGGGSISISRAGVQDLKNAWNEVKSIF